MATHADIEELLARREDTDFEVKAGQGRDGDGDLPRSVWESYSAIANTEGGIILLGLHQPAKVLKVFWDQVNDRHVVSANVLQSDDTQVIEHNGKHLLCIQAPRATRQQRPVYIGPNPLTGTYRRNFEGDYRCDQATVRRMLADSSDESRDAHLLPGFGLADLDLESLAAYRNLFRSARPGHPWITLDECDFLAKWCVYELRSRFPSAARPVATLGARAAGPPRRRRQRSRKSRRLARRTTKSLFHDLAVASPAPACGDRYGTMVKVDRRKAGRRK